MAVRTRIQPLTRTQLVEFVGAAMTGKGRSDLLAQVARAELRSAQERNKNIIGRVPPHKSYVDGQQTERYEAVKPDGEILITFELMDDIFEWIGEQLLIHSPVGQPDDPRPGHPGMYQRSHAFIVDYKVYDPGEPLPAGWHEAFFANTVPYARRIERGWSSQAPDGVYHAVAELANRRFGNLAKIRFGYRDLPFGAVDEWAARTNMPSLRKVDRDIWLRRQPAVVITPR